MRRRSNKLIYIFMFLLIMAGGGGFYIYTSQSFERESPKIEISELIYWNLKTPIKVKITDNTGISYYKVILSDGKNETVLAEAKLENPLKEIDLRLKAPKIGLIFANNVGYLKITAKDNSRWNYFAGNETEKDVKIIIDKKRPSQYIVINSYMIKRGGTALVVFKAVDENMKDIYIQTNFEKRFKAVPFYKEGYYIALVAWPITQNSFRATVVSTDKAGNVSKSYIKYFLKDVKYKKSIIHLKDSFLKGKISDIASEYPETEGMSLVEKFKFVNETLRGINEKLIEDITSQVPEKMVKSFSIKPFYPLKNGAKLGGFGDHRYYYYGKKLVSESYHLGYDFASIKQAPIKASNKAEVVYAEYNGIYGNMPILYHGLGLYTLYGHCSAIMVEKGDQVQKGEIIAKTGMTGLALGDHLHFGTVVQGVEVNPLEWMDKKWIKINITDIIKDAKKLINKEI
ncbi:M23 family metallopeptidase [Nitrosophilus alvini]|uniref:M23 family metallopeptidase n=1 Tax=Nitrosophilus alvini TaxID=2714855 RepID=UPI001F163C82|nr:M23 family metallopeptidase [Nitrosophilus alvini]